MSVRHSGDEHCRKDRCLLRRNHSAGLWGVVLRGGCGLFAEWSGLLGPRPQGEGTEPERTSAFPLKYIHDGIVQLSEHHKVDGKAGGAVLGGRIAREPGESIVLLQHKPVERTHGSGTGLHCRAGIASRVLGTSGREASPLPEAAPDSPPTILLLDHPNSARIALPPRHQRPDMAATGHT